MHFWHYKSIDRAMHYVGGNAVHMKQQCEDMCDLYNCFCFTVFTYVADGTEHPPSTE